MKTYVDTTETTSCLEWCAGYGGISLGLKRAIPSLRTIAFGEIEAFACANLVAKMEAGLLDPAPIWTDLKTFPCERFRDRVDILVAGYPCQPFSAAGKRLGTEDPRHLWPFIQRSISIIRPRLCFFENVEGHITLGLSTVISDLEEMGYRTTWGIFSASEVGAPHQRKRVFILAYRKEQGLEGLRRLESDFIWNDASSHGATGGEELANSLRNGSGKGWLIRQGTDGSEPVSDGEARRDAWPSRPGEPQHGWEPPRVVGSVPAKLANFCTRDAQSGGDSASTGGEGSGERREGEDSMLDCGSSLRGRDQGNEQQKGLAHTGSLGRRGWGDGDAGGLRGEIQTAGSCGGGAEAMGNAEQFLLPTTREHRAMDEASGISTNGEGCEPTQADPITGATREREGNGSNASECGEIECEVGRNAYEPSIGVDFAELSGLCDSELAEIREWMVKTDNRTDELRLLGNGVVVATAEKAFTTLLGMVVLPSENNNS